MRYSFPRGNQCWKLRDQKRNAELVKIAVNKPEHKAKISATMTKKWKDEEYRKKMINSFSKRQKPTKEKKLKASQTLKEKYNNGLIIPSNLGRKFSDEINKKKGRKGKLNVMKNPDVRKKHLLACRTYGKQWKGGISFTPYTKEFTFKFKKFIRKRDNYICLKCRKHQEKNKKSLCIHHINYDKTLSIPENCCSLCFKCHSEVNWNRKHWTKFFQSLLSERYGYKYNSKRNIVYQIQEVRKES